MSELLITLFFLFLGVAIGIYLNQLPLIKKLPYIWYKFRDRNEPWNKK